MAPFAAAAAVSFWLTAWSCCCRFCCAVCWPRDGCWLIVLPLPLPPLPLLVTSPPPLLLGASCWLAPGLPRR